MSTGNRVFLRLVICAVLLGASGSSAFAQRGRGFGFGPNRAQLATLKEVKESLKLSEEQGKVAAEATAVFNREVGELFRAAAGDIEKVRMAMPALHAKATTAINDKLNDVQRKRLTGIYIQQNGVNSVFDPQVRAILKLTEEQMAALEVARVTNRQEGTKEAAAVVQFETREERNARFEKVWKESEDRILNLLTSAQNEEFKKLRGEELEVNVRPLFPPPPPGKRGRNL